MFGVVVCPSCNYARGIKLSAKRSKCPRCGATHQVSRLRIYFITDNESELGEAIRSAAIQLRQKNLRLPDFDIDQDVSATVRRATGGMRRKRLSKEEIEAISSEIMEKHGEFTLDSFEKVLMERYPEEAGRIMERLRAEERMSPQEKGDLCLELVEDLGPDNRRTSREERVIFLLRCLSERQGSFTKEEVKRTLGISAKEEIDDLMAKLLEKGIITETKLGIFKMV